MASRFQRSGFYALMLVSLSVHGALLYGFSSQARAAQPRPSPPLRLSIRMPAMQPPAPDVPAGPEPVVSTPAPIERRVKTARRQAKAEEPAKPASRPVELEQAESAAVDFTGLTLTNPNGKAGWASLTGNGQEMRGALGAAVRGGGTGEGSGAGAGTRPRTEGGGSAVAAEKLSRAPRAPALNDALRANYPAQARAQGMAGRALLRVRIQADGRVGQSFVLSASAPEFGRACQRTLAGSRWSAALDQRGQPVATDVSYQCQFEVDR